ncbi:phage BR0599 family protein [Candidatus Bandiella euplotis]|uniref:Phage protein n=1 Tax=Candidatus Bandiella euplotis TaxID=1664265 RepID=A0ABZ0UL45_9RICK|nr:phage BR0599 family protein [Candidatus Bandiella woodruffii]WPX96865.1 Putative phage protein [Candidatus Bandiella woodruffii]
MVQTSLNQTITFILILSFNAPFLDEARQESAFYYNDGIIKFLSGTNKGISYDIINFKDKIVQVMLPPLQQLNVNDQYEITAGCDKSFTKCVKKFNNAINFRGEPHISTVIKNL